MSAAKHLLVEIGTEELPPTALRRLMEAFRDHLVAGLDAARLAHGEARAYGSPRRLAVIVEDLVERQQDRAVEQKGPPTRIAFDDDGNPTPAATAFAKKCGVDVAELGRSQTDKGEWLSFSKTEAGLSAAELLPGLIDTALAELPIPRRMRWGSSDTEFVRPVHWVVLLHGSDVVAATIMGVDAGNETRGHRIHGERRIVVASADEYLDVLERRGFVIADFERRRQLVQGGVEAEAQAAGGEVVDGESLYDEVTALVEWPVPLTGSFDDEFLELPRETIVSTLTGHQRYFPIADSTGKLLPFFVTVANIESTKPESVRDGNERVIRPRLADAAFFWNSDRQRTLAAREEFLRDVVYQKGLGSLHDKSSRVARIASWLAKKLGVNVDYVKRAAVLAKCDLITGMVGEFPELQGTMGRYYAAADGEAPEVANAIGEHYKPRFAGDELPATPEGKVLAVADKLDALAGVFMLGKKPSGSSDPFGLRRAALGVVRILIEGALDIDLPALIAKAAEAQSRKKLKGALGADETAAELHGFIVDRLRHYFLDRDSGLDNETFDSVAVREPASLLDFDRRIAAVQTFARLDQAESLAAANKRIANILRKADNPSGLSVTRKLLQDDAEVALHSALCSAREKVEPLLASRSYAEVLNTLADLREPVDRFFDEVMVMDEDEQVRNNRLALLSELRALFLDVADISRLSIA